MFNIAKIRERIVEVATTEAELTASDASEVAFHLTDWLSDLSAFADFCAHPESYSPERANSLLLAFLSHAPNHVAAAAKLYADYPVSDVFGVGAVDTSTNAGT